MGVNRTKIGLYILFFLLFSSFSVASITWYGEDISLIVDTFYLDTNVTTECGDNEFLLGNGSCVDSSVYLPGASYSDSWINNTFPGLFFNFLAFFHQQLTFSKCDNLSRFQYFTPIKSSGTDSPNLFMQ